MTTSAVATNDLPVRVLKRVTRALVAVAHHPEGTLAVVLVVGILLSGLLVSRDVLTVGNMTLLMQAMIPQLAVALGVCVALYSGIADLSIGSTMLIAGMTFAVMSQLTESLPLCILVAIAAAVGVGLVNSVLVVGFGVDSIVATLAAMLGGLGLALVIGGELSQVSFAFGWSDIVDSKLGPLPIPFLVLVLLYLVVAVLLAKTRSGRHLLAVGAGPKAAKRLGIRVGGWQAFALVLSAAAAGFGGVLAVGIVGAAPITLGAQDVFMVFSGVILGGFSIARGGVGNPLGAFLGIATLSVMLNVLSNASVEPGWQDISIGIALLIAIALDRVRYGRYTPSAVA